MEAGRETGREGQVGHGQETFRQVEWTYSTQVTQVTQVKVYASRRPTSNNKCAVCGREKKQKPGEKNWNFKIRQTCSEECHREMLSAKKRELKRQGLLRWGCNKKAGCSPEMAQKIVDLIMGYGGGVEVRMERMFGGKRKWR